MTFLTWLAAALASLLVGFLFVALLFPEKLP